MHPVYTAVFEPGFFASAQVHAAVTLGGVVAVVGAVIGVFTVMRGQSFAGHALGDVSAAGGSGALLAGLSPVAGFVGLGVIGAGRHGHDRRAAGARAGTWPPASCSAPPSACPPCSCT